MSKFVWQLAQCVDGRFFRNTGSIWINKLVTTDHFGILITESLNMSLSFHSVMIGIVQKLRESEPVVAKRHVRFDMEGHATLTTSQ